jgi:hypothetical protein
MGEITIRQAQEPMQLVKTVEAAVWAVDGEQPVARVRSMDDIQLCLAKIKSCASPKPRTPAK